MRFNKNLLLLSLMAVAVSGNYCKPASDIQPTTKGFAPINGIQMYYEVYGVKGDIPLLLLHGGASTIPSTFGKAIPLLAKTHRLIALEEQAHGRTSDRNTPLRFTTSSDDAAALLNYLKIAKADVFGFSNGASIALELAIRHPAKVRKLIFASSLTKKSGAPPELWNFIAQGGFEQMPQALKDAFLKVNPNPAKLKNLYEKTRERMVNFHDTPDAAVKGIKAETLILTGDHDVATLEHVLELTRLIQGARLMVLPYGHGDYIGEVSATLSAALVPEFTLGLVEEFLAQQP